MAVQAEPTFSLKDALFNQTKVQKIAGELAMAYPEFDEVGFVKKVCSQFKDKELKERIFWIRDCLRAYLPQDYETALGVILDSLPSPCDPTLSDNDFGDFIYCPYGVFVAEYGCTENYVHVSLTALSQITMRFSAEFPVRSFLNMFPRETMKIMQEWVMHEHYHVRRLVSEGTRPSLPWAKKISLDYHAPMAFLDILHTDPTRFVTRSVANHLNDISKLDPELVITTLLRWQKQAAQSESELDFIIRHSLRTLEKQGHAAALQLLGYGGTDIQIDKFAIKTLEVVVGNELVFTCTLTSTGTTAQTVLLDYNLYFQKASGKLAPKTFKLAKFELAPGENRTFTKRQLLRPMTTRKLYSGKHQVELQVNGVRSDRHSFLLQMK